MGEDNNLTAQEREEFCKNYYEEDADFKLFVDRCAKNDHVTVEEALKRMNAYVTALYYIEKKKDKIEEEAEEVAETVNVGCGVGATNWSAIECNEDE